MNSPMMKLIISDPESNWDLYDNGYFVKSVAKEGTGCSDSFFGSYAYFRKYVNHKIRLNKDFKNHLTVEGKRLYKELGGKQ